MNSPLLLDFFHLREYTDDSDHVKITNCERLEYITITIKFILKRYVKIVNIILLSMKFSVDLIITNVI